MLKKFYSSALFFFCLIGFSQNNLTLKIEITSSKNEIINEINIYLKRNDSLVFLLIKNYQISRNAYNNLSKLKNECKDFMKHHKTINDTAIVCSYFKVLKSELNFKLNQRTMKVDAYKITKTSKKGKVKIKRLHKDLYIFRDNPKYKNLYEKNKLN